MTRRCSWRRKGRAAAELHRSANEGKFASMKIATVWGIGPLWGSLAFGYGAVTTVISFSYPILRVPDSIALLSLVLGITMVAVGIPFYVLSAKAIFRGFAEGRLLTEGVYAACRHPVYGSWIVFIIPGIELILRSWLGLTTVVFAYLLLRFLARSEEDYLLERFGDSYRQYRARTPFVLPYGIFTTWLGRATESL